MLSKQLILNFSNDILNLKYIIRNLQLLMVWIQKKLNKVFFYFLKNQLSLSKSKQLLPVKIQDVN